MEKLSGSLNEVRFADFAVDLQAGELRKNGVKIRLQRQPFQILSIFFERPGEVVTQEELQHRLWPGNTYVDFDQSLGTAIRKLRRALGDSAAHPRYIETLPQRGYRFIATMEASPPAGKPIVAVLPFENPADNDSQDYFSDGITEEMIACLGRTYHQRLGVIAWASAVRYKNTGKDIDQIGRELGADYVLKGSVRRAGSRLRITVEFIQVKDRTQLWAESFECGRAQILLVHRTVARRVGHLLHIELSAAKRGAMSGTSTTNPEAHAAFLKGRYALNKGTSEAVENAIQHFEDAVSRDPRYAVAYAGLAVTLNLADHFRILPGRQAFPRAKAAAIKALELNDALPEAYNALAMAKHSFDGDWAGAEQIYQRAIELNPNYATARHWHGFYLGMLGRVDEAIAEMQRAQKLNPLSLIIRTHLGLVLYWGRRYDEAIEQLRHTIEMEHDFAAAHYFLGWAFEQKGMYKEAVACHQAALAICPGCPDRIGALGHVYAVCKRRGDAERALGELLKLSERRFVSAYDFAIVYVGLGDIGQAFRWLEKACEERSFSMLMSLKSEPRLDCLRSDPRFQDLMRRVGLPV